MRCRTRIILLIFNSLFVLLFSLQDQHEHCQAWAERGECSSNPNYMLVMCKASCNEHLREHYPVYYFLLHFQMQMTASIADLTGYLHTIGKLFTSADEFQTDTNERSLFKLLLEGLTEEDLPLPMQQDLSLKNRYGFMVNGTFKGVSYYHINDTKIIDQVLNYVKPSLREFFSVSLMSITSKFATIFMLIFIL